MGKHFKKFRIWWSPVGHENGDTIITAADKSEANSLAYDEMRKRSEIGAYGAEEITTEK